ncbi:hypothetical protein V6N11_082938 [Hibiscus sabdariffa]|uniref:Uncharacterized protein n=1 Tax=Hibiscus sabdariffa TaxID=183260 RepID=A0ABR2QKX3_9ROSI
MQFKPLDTTLLGRPLDPLSQAASLSLNETSEVMNMMHNKATREVVQFFKKLTNDRVTRTIFPIQGRFPSLSGHNLVALDNTPTLREIQEALIDMASLRSPGRNLYTPNFAFATRIHRHASRSMRTIHFNFYQSTENNFSFSSSVPERSGFVSENLTKSVIDMRLDKLVAKAKSVKSESENEEFLDISQAFGDFSACSSEISRELQRLASLSSPKNVLKESNGGAEAEPEPEPELESCHGFL